MIQGSPYFVLELLLARMVGCDKLLFNSFRTSSPSAYMQCPHNCLVCQDPKTNEQHVCCRIDAIGSTNTRFHD